MRGTQTPDGPTRRQFVTWLWRAAGGPEPSSLGSEIFEDSAEGSSDQAVGWAFEQGVTRGCASDDRGLRWFCPQRPATRAQIATLLYRYVRSQHEGDSGFADVDPASYYAPSVAWMRHHGITTGCREDAFCPQKPATRAHAATFVYRIAQRPESWGPAGGILRPN